MSGLPIIKSIIESMFNLYEKLMRLGNICPVTADRYSTIQRSGNNIFFPFTKTMKNKDSHFKNRTLKSINVYNLKTNYYVYLDFKNINSDVFAS